MVYESDFYTTRRPYTRPISSHYTVTTPRHYVVRDYPNAGVRSAQEQYSYSYTNTSSSDPYSRPQRMTQETTYKRESGPYGTYSTERSTRSGDGPGGYRSSYDSHTTGRLPGGTTYRHYSYRNPGAIIRPIPPLQQQQVRKYPHHLPYVAHKKLVSVVHTPYPVVYYTHTVPVPIRIYSRVRPSVIAAELQRIRDLPRPSSVSYVTRYLNSKDNILFDDEAREIRARADSLLRRIHVFVPRPTTSEFAEVIVPERMRSDDYVRRVLTARKNAKKDESEPVNWYESPEHRQFGSGNLAAVAYTGGKPHSRRRPYYKLADLRAADVQSDVNLLSFYAKNRQAAASAYPDTPLTEREQRKARALADDRVYAMPKKASPDPEPVYKPAKEKTRKPRKIMEPESVAEAEPIIIEPKIEETEVEFRPPTPEPAAPEPEPEPVQEPAPIEVIPEPEPVIEPEPEPIIEAEPIVEASEAIPEVEAVPEPTIEEDPAPVEPEVEPVVVEQLDSDPVVIESEVDALPVANDEDLEETVAPIETESIEEPISCAAEQGENQEDDEVLQRKLDDEELRRQVEELKRQAEEEKRRQAEEARLAEERYKAEIEERVRLAEEARQARLREIEEQERLEAERQAEEARLEAERVRDLKLAEEEKRAAEYEAVLAAEEEQRYAIEKAADEARKRQELEEKLASEVALGFTEEVTAPESTSDECHCHDNVKSQDHEERPDSPDADDDTHIEEEAGCISTDHDEISEHYDGEHEGFNSTREFDTPVEVIPRIEEINSEEDDEES